MNLQGERLIPASVERTWTALNDPDTLKACIAGCESIERTEENQYLCTMAVRIGPVNARFKGKLQLTDIVPMESYRINFDGQGGVAGFGKGHADVRLVGEGDDSTRLGYKADAQVGGKIAQIGSRLVESAAAKIADDFFKAFEARMRDGAGDADGSPGAGTQPGSATAPPAAPDAGGAAPSGGAAASSGAAKFAAAAAGNAAAGAAVAGADPATATEAAAARAGLPGSERTLGSVVRPPSKQGSRGMLWWIIGIIVLVLIAWAAFG
ncbi:MAG: carbon monoxide dehydrogenase subunit G [Burkholderiaceae bacterium]|nr:carbon monoxide dehydrogenase subunit G [Burkholderiaceae bacterium]